MNRKLLFLILTCIVLTHAQEWSISNPETCIREIHQIWVRLQQSAMPRFNINLDEIHFGNVLKLNNSQRLEIKDMVNEVVKQSAPLPTCIHEQTPAAKQSFTNLISFLLEKAFIQHVEKDGLGYCHCVPISKRIMLILLIIQDVQKQFPNKNHTLTISSLASGVLFQDYLLIAALIKMGYRKFHLNIIDTNYPNISEQLKLARTGTEEAALTDQLALLKDQLGASDAKVRKEIIDKIFDISAKQDYEQIAEDVVQFKALLTEGTDNKQLQLTTHIYKSGYDYFDALKTEQKLRKEKNLTGKHSVKKTDLLLLVDPGWGFSQALPSQANVLSLQDKKTKQKFYLFIPRHQAAQLWARKPVDQKSPLLKKLKQLIKKTGANTQFNPQLQSQINAGALSKFAEIAYLDLVFTTFQDLVNTVLRKNGLAFALHQDPFGNVKRDTSKLHKIDLKQYAKEDLIAKYLPPILKEGFREAYEKIEF